MKRLAMIVGALGPAAPVSGDISPRGFDQAAAYSLRHDGHALVIARSADIVFEAYSARASARTAFPLASGTKSFWCAAYAAGVQDGLFSGETKVADHLIEWQSDPQKRDITVRQLLSYTSGLHHGVREMRKPAKGDLFGQVLSLRSVAMPGKTFQYGPSHVTAFGAFLSHALGGASPLEYLNERVFSPIGMQVHSWREDARGMPMMASGARLQARQWLKFGQLLENGGQWQGTQVLPAAALAECTSGSRANPMFGLTLWLNSAPDPLIGKRRGNPMRADSVVNGYIAPNAPKDMFMAVGAGNQRLYVIPSLDLTIVRFGRKNTAWNDAAFLGLLLQ